MKQLINLSNENLKASLPNKHTIKLTRKGTEMSHAVEFGVKKGKDYLYSNTCLWVVWRVSIMKH